MKNTSRVKVYLLNAYSNYDSNSFFISGSDKVALEFASIDPVNSIIIGPVTLKKILPAKANFISSQNNFTKILVIDYLIRVINTIRILKNLEFCDYIISSSDFFCDTTPGAIFSMGRRWLVFTYHLYPAYSVNKKFRDFAGRLVQDFSYFLYRFSNKIYTSNFECVEYLKNNFEYNNIIKIPLGIRLKDYHSAKNKDIDLVFLGRIKESKGIFELPEIVSIARKKIPHINVVVIGNGPENDKQKLKELDKKYKSELQMVGSISDQEVKDYLSRSKILIQLDSEAGFGLNIVEALASGCRVVGYNLPSYTDNFSKLGLQMTPQKDKHKVAATISSILKNKKANELDRSLLKKYDWNEIYNIIFSN